MPLYLTKFSYTPQTWARLIGAPEDRRKAAESYIESVGGKLLTMYPWPRSRSRSVRGVH